MVVIREESWAGGNFSQGQKGTPEASFGRVIVQGWER